MIQSDIYMLMTEKTKINIIKKNVIMRFRVIKMTKCHGLLLNSN